MIADGARNTIVIRGGCRPRHSRTCYARTMPGVRLIQNSKGEYARTLLWGVSSSRHQCCSLVRPRKPNRGTEMKNSPYLDKPFIPLAVALRSMLAETEAKIPTAAPAEKARLQQRAQVLRDWLRLKSTTPVSTE